MAVDDPDKPEWALRIEGGERLGTGVALSPRLVLTSERVVRGLALVDVSTVHGVTLRCRVVDPDRELDVAVLEPASPDAGFSDAAVLVPRALRQDLQLHENRAVIATWMDEPDVPRALRIRLRRVAHGGRRVRFRVHGPRKGVRRGAAAALWLMPLGERRRHGSWGSSGRMTRTRLTRSPRKVRAGLYRWSGSPTVTRQSRSGWRRRSSGRRHGSGTGNRAHAALSGRTTTASSSRVS